MKQIFALILLVAAGSSKARDIGYSNQSQNYWPQEQLPADANANEPETPTNVKVVPYQPSL